MKVGNFGNIQQDGQHLVERRFSKGAQDHDWFIQGKNNREVARHVLYKIWQGYLSLKSLLLFRS